MGSIQAIFGPYSLLLGQLMPVKSWWTRSQARVFRSVLLDIRSCVPLSSSFLCSSDIYTPSINNFLKCQTRIIFVLRFFFFFLSPLLFFFSFHTFIFVIFDDIQV